MEQEPKKKVTRKPKTLPLQEKEVKAEPKVEVTHNPIKDVTVKVFEHPTVQSYGTAAQEFIKKHNIYKLK